MKYGLKILAFTLIFTPTIFLGQETIKNKIYTELNEHRESPPKKLALLLPFNLQKIQTDTINTVAERLKKDKFLNMTLDFYSGVLIAIDSARQLGITMDITILDSEETKNSSNVANLIKTHKLENFSAVIGPFYQTHVEKTAELLSPNHVAVISPLSKEIGKSYPNLFQTITTNSTTRNLIFDYLHTKKGNIIAIVDKKKAAVKKYITENHKDVRFAPLDSNGNLSSTDLKNMLVSNAVNYVLLETNNTTMIKTSITTLLHVLPKFNVQLVILESNETLDTDEIELTNLVKLKLIYPAITRENKSPEALIFEKIYKQKNKVSPNAFATRGFDITFDTLMRLSKSSTYEASIATGLTEQIESKFDYFKNETGGFSNKGVYIFYYDTDLTIKEAQ